MDKPSELSCFMDNLSELCCFMDKLSEPDLNLTCSLIEVGIHLDRKNRYPLVGVTPAGERHHRPPSSLSSSKAQALTHKNTLLLPPCDIRGRTPPRDLVLHHDNFSRRSFPAPATRSSQRTCKQELRILELHCCASRYSKLLILVLHCCASGHCFASTTKNSLSLSLSAPGAIFAGNASSRPALRKR